MAEGLAKGVTSRVNGLFENAIGTLAFLRLRCRSFRQGCLELEL